METNLYFLLLILIVLVNRCESRILLGTVNGMDTLTLQEKNELNDNADNSEYTTQETVDNESIIRSDSNNDISKDSKTTLEDIIDQKETNTAIEMNYIAENKLITNSDKDVKIIEDGYKKDRRRIEKSGDLKKIDEVVNFESENNKNIFTQRVSVAPSVLNKLRNVNIHPNDTRSRQSIISYAGGCLPGFIKEEEDDGEKCCTYSYQIDEAFYADYELVHCYRLNY